MLVLTRRLTHAPTEPVPKVEVNPALLTLSLTAEQRSRSRHRFTTDDGQPVHLQLPRGTVLQDGDVLLAAVDESSAARPPMGVKILAKPEPILTVTAITPLDLLRGAYHLGNRHVPLEITSTHLRLAPDSVLEAMLTQLGLQVIHDIAPFNPEAGAYGSPFPHAHHTPPHEHSHVIH